jgi:hypothetical protein
MRRFFLGAVVAAMLVVASVGTAAADTSPWVEPPIVTPGQTVTFLNGCLGVVEPAPDEVRVAFTHGDEVPQEGAAEKTTGRLTAEFTYTIVVPSLEAAVYSVWLECQPDDWRTNLSEPGGTPVLTVLAGPETATEPFAPAPSPGGLPLVLAMVGGFALGVAAFTIRVRRR